GNRAGGAWTLEQACWHIKYPMERASPAPADAVATPEQQKIQGFVDQVLASGWPEGLQAAKEMVPPADPGAEAVGGGIAGAGRGLQGNREARVNAFVFGPVETERLRRFVLIHAAHHLSFLEPTSK